MLLRPYAKSPAGARPAPTGKGWRHQELGLPLHLDPRHLISGHALLGLGFTEQASRYVDKPA